MDAQTSSLSDRLKQDYLEHTLLDFGWWKASCCLSNREDGQWRDIGMGTSNQGQLLQLIGRLGQGLGGFSVKRKNGREVPESCEMVAATVYCAAWVHFSWDETRSRTSESMLIWLTLWVQLSRHVVTLGFEWKLVTLLQVLWIAAPPFFVSNSAVSTVSSVGLKRSTRSTQPTWF